MILSLRFFKVFFYSFFFLIWLLINYSGKIWSSKKNILQIYVIFLCINIYDVQRNIIITKNYLKNFILYDKGRLGRTCPNFLIINFLKFHDIHEILSLKLLATILELCPRDSFYTHSVPAQTTKGTWTTKGTSIALPPLPHTTMSSDNTC